MVSETITITIKQTGYFTMVAWLVLVSGDKTSRVVVSLFFLFSSFQDEERGGNNKETGCPVSSTKVNHATRVTTLFLQWIKLRKTLTHVMLIILMQYRCMSHQTELMDCSCFVQHHWKLTLWCCTPHLMVHCPECVRFSVLEAQWCWYCCKLDTVGGIQSVEQQVGKDVEAVQEIRSADSWKVGEVMSCWK